MTEREIVSNLRALLQGDALEDTDLSDAATRTFDEGGYLTSSQGFTLRLPSDENFQITVCQDDDPELENQEGGWLTEDDIIWNFQALLRGEDIDDTDLREASTCTFEHGGYLTYDEGFTLHTYDGSCFQITIRQER